MAIIDGTSGDDSIPGTSGDDLIRGLGGNDFIRAGEGADTIDGGAGQDMAQFDGGPANSGPPVIVNLSTVAQTVGGTIYAPSTALDRFGFTDTLISIEEVRGAGGPDVFFGANGHSFFQGRGGSDTYYGGTPTLSPLDTFYNGRYNWVDYRQDGGPSGIAVNFGTGTGVDSFGNTEYYFNIVAVRATPGNDSLIGDDYYNFFQPLGGNDTVNGAGGRDRVDYSIDARYGGNAAVNVNLSTGIAIDGFGGTDSLANIDQIIGTSGNDTIIGSNSDETLLSGLDGNDRLVGLGGVDVMRPGLGADTVDGTPGPEGDNAYEDVDVATYTELIVDRSALGLIANLGTDPITVEGHIVSGGTARDPGGFTDTLIDIEGIRGTAGRDFIQGATFANGVFERFSGNAGDDTVDGGFGLNAIDYVNDGGSSGAKVNLSNAPINVGGDTIGARQALDTWGDTDTLLNINMVLTSVWSDYVLGSARDDIFRLYGGADTIDGALGPHDAIQIVDPSLSLDLLGPGAELDLANGTLTTWFSSATAMLRNVEDARGTYRGDDIAGNNFSNWLAGDPGDDTISGAGGNDIVWGDQGNNILTGGEGFDYVAYNTDLTKIEYLNSIGLFANPITPTGVVVDLAVGTANNGLGGIDTLSGFEGIYGSYLADSLGGDAADNWFRGMSGDDTIDGRAGRDTVSYAVSGAGRDIEVLLIPGQNASIPNGVIVDLSAGTASDGEGGTDTLFSIENVVGSFGNDQIRGSSSANNLSGGEGDDTLTGGGGDDLLDGGTGLNTAVYSGARSSYSISYIGVSWTVTDLRGTAPDGVDTLTNIRFVQFSDTLVNLGALASAAARVVDGYIAGATVFRDTNNNGIRDSGELFTTTASDGTFVLDGSGPLVSVGGVDTSTGLPFILKMTATAGDVISPLTTLVDKMTAQGIANAEAVLVSALGLAPGTEIYNTDPLASAVVGDAVGTQLLAAGMQVATTTKLVAASLASAGANVGDLALTALAAQFGSGTPDLSDATAISALVASTAALASVIADPEFTENAAVVIAGVNAALETEAAGQGEQGGSPLALARISSVAHTAVADVLEAANGSAAVLDAALGGVVESGLASLIASTFLGTSAADILVATSGNDTIRGFAGADVIRPGAGDDYVDAGLDSDRVEYAAQRTEITLTRLTDGSVQATGLLIGTDILQGVERLDLSDGDFVFDVVGSQSAVVYRLYQAAFARTPDEGGFRYWADAADAFGISALALAREFRIAPEFIQKYGSNVSDFDYTYNMYRNVLGREPDQGGIMYWTSQVTLGIVSRDQLLIEFSESLENKSLTQPNTEVGFWVNGGGGPATIGGTSTGSVTEDSALTSTSGSFTSYDGANLQPNYWSGRHVAVSTAAAGLDASVMQKILGGLDSAFEAYFKITGRGPSPYHEYNGLLHIAEVPTAFNGNAAAIGFVGFSGIEITTPAFRKLYNDVATTGTFDQVLFYELGRNFWFYGDKLGALNSFVTAFAIVNRFVSMEIAQLPGSAFNSTLAFSEFRTSIVDDLSQIFYSGANYTLANTIQVGQSVANPNNWGAGDLEASFFYRIYEDFGLETYASFFQKLPALPTAANPAAAIQNFIQAATQATGIDHNFLNKPLNVTYQTGGRTNDNLMAASNGLPVFGFGGNDTINGTAVSDRLFGGSGNDTLSGDAGADQLIGGAGADTLIGGAGNDLLVGAAGGDIAQYSGPASSYSWTLTAPGTYSVTDLGPNSPDGTDTLRDVELLKFSDQTINLIGLPAARGTILYGNGNVIGDGDTTPALDDFTDFGDVTQGSAVTRVFSVQNSGVSTLNISALTLPNGFSLIDALSSPIAPGTSDTFTVAMDTTAAGAKSGSISFVVNGDTSNPYNFSVSGRIDPTPTASGTLSIIDVDLGQDEFQTPASLAGTYGTFTFNASSGAWAYFLDNTKAQPLAAGATATDSLAVTSKDDSARKVISVNVKGVNDTASIVGTATGSVTEDGTLTTGGTLTITDPDTGENKFQAPTNLVGAYGDFNFNATSGAWGYTLENVKAQPLAGGSTVTETLSVKSLDGTATKTITVTINGASDFSISLVSNSSTGILGNNASGNATLSGNGKYIVFDSLFNELVSNDANSDSDLLIRDTTTNQTSLVSHSLSTPPGGGYISADGSTVVFDSDSINLVGADTSGARDIFVVYL